MNHPTRADLQRDLLNTAECRIGRLGVLVEYLDNRFAELGINDHALGWAMGMMQDELLSFSYEQDENSRHLDALDGNQGAAR